MKSYSKYNSALLCVVIVVQLICPAISINAQNPVDVYLPAVMIDGTGIDLITKSQSTPEIEGAAKPSWLSSFDENLNTNPSTESPLSAESSSSTPTLSDYFNVVTKSHLLPAAVKKSGEQERPESTVAAANNKLHPGKKYILEIDRNESKPSWLTDDMIIGSIKKRDIFHIRLPAAYEKSGETFTIPPDSNVVGMTEEGDDTVLSIPMVTAEKRYFGSGSGDMTALKRYFGSGSNDADGLADDMIVKPQHVFLLDEEWLSWPYELLALSDLHTVSQGENVTIAVLDTGVDYYHEMFDGNIALSMAYDYVDDDTNPFDARNYKDDDKDDLVDEGTGHGTHVTGVVYNMAPKATIVPIRVLNSDGQGKLWDIVSGIHYAVDIGADIINMSFGTNEDHSALAGAIEYAHQHGVILVASAGNSGDRMTYPAKYPQVISVGAIDKNSVIASFSEVYEDSVDILTPGVTVFSAFADDKYAFLTGTSMSSPFAAGMYALADEFDNE